MKPSNGWPRRLTLAAGSPAKDPAQSPGRGRPRRLFCPATADAAVQMLVQVSLVVPQFQLDSHMLFAATAPHSVVPHFTFDAVHSGNQLRHPPVPAIARRFTRPLRLCAGSVRAPDAGAPSGAGDSWPVASQPADQSARHARSLVAGPSRRRGSLPRPAAAAAGLRRSLPDAARR